MVNQLPIDDNQDGKVLAQHRSEELLNLDHDDIAKFFEHYDLLDQLFLQCSKTGSALNVEYQGPEVGNDPNDSCTPEGFRSYIKNEDFDVPMEATNLSSPVGKNSFPSFPHLGGTAFAQGYFQYHDTFHNFNPYNSTSESSFNSANNSLTHLQFSPMGNDYVTSCAEIPTEFALDTPLFSQPITYGATMATGNQINYGNGDNTTRGLMNFGSSISVLGPSVSDLGPSISKLGTSIANLGSSSNVYRNGLSNPTPGTEMSIFKHENKSKPREKADIVIHSDRSLSGWPFTGEPPTSSSELQGFNKLLQENSELQLSRTIPPVKKLLATELKSRTRKGEKPTKALDPRYQSTGFVTLSPSSVQCLGVILDYHGYKGRIYKKVINLNISNISYAFHDPTERRKLAGCIFHNTCKPHAIIEGGIPDEPSTQTLLVVSGALQRQVHFREIPDIINSVSCIAYVKLAKFTIDNPYEPQYYRYEIDQEGNAIPESKCGLCAFCPIVKFKPFKNSSYLSHLTLEHGIFANGYVIPEVLYYGDYQNTRSGHDNKYRKAIQCPACFEVIEVSCWKNKSNPLLSYFRHFKKSHQNLIRSFNRSTIDPVDVRNRSYSD